MKEKEIDLEQISVLKTVMMLCVVLYHSMLPTCGLNWGGVILNRSNPFFGFFAGWLNTFHIQFFTFASGYLFFMIRYEKGRYRDTRNDISKRFKRLLIPYLIVSLLWAFPAKEIAYGWSWSILYRDFLFAVAPEQLWFLPMLFNIFVFYYFFSDVILNRSYIKIFVFLYNLYIVSLIVKQYIPIGVFQIGTAVQFLLYYYIGIIFRKETLQITWKQTLICLLVSLFGWYYIRNIKNTSEFIFNILLPIESFAGAVSLYGLGKLFQVQRITSNKIYLVLAVNSMGIYLFHQQLIYFLMRYLDGYIKLDFVLVLFIFLGSLLGSLLISISLSYTKLGRIAIGISSKKNHGLPK